MSEISPIQYISRLSKFWWVVVFCTLAGGGIGFLYSRIKPPIYEAKAIFNVNIDLSKVPIDQQPLELHDEDIALASLWGTMMSPEVFDYLIAEAKNQDISLDWNIIYNNYTVERKNTIWELRYRSHNPQLAQTVVSIWATKTFSAAQARQADHNIPAYVIFTPPLISDSPTQPVYYGLMRLLLAGSVIGLLVGFMGAEQAARRLS